MKHFEHSNDLKIIEKWFVACEGIIDGYKIISAVREFNYFWKIYVVLEK